MPQLAVQVVPQQATRESSYAVFKAKQTVRSWKANSGIQRRSTTLTQIAHRMMLPPSYYNIGYSLHYFGKCTTEDITSTVSM